MSEPIIPEYGSRCVSDLMAHLLRPEGSGSALDPTIGVAPQRVLIVLDGLGWDQLVDRWALAPSLRSMSGGPITSVAPTTTATALTSITTSLTPGEHGVVGYRMMVDGEVLNTLRWGTRSRPDARQTMPPDILQPYAPFQGEPVSVVTKAEFTRSGFTKAHLRGANLACYRTPATLVHEVVAEIRRGEPLVYAYWDGIDKVAHEYGLGSVYEAEVRFADALVGEILASLPSGVEVIVTADHGQVDCADGAIDVDEAVMAMTSALSGEGRFRWLHSDRVSADELAAAAIEAHANVAWVRTREQTFDEGWFGPTVSPEAASRLGDVALLPFEPISFNDPDDTGIFDLIGRHGSLTSAEVLVPLLSAVV